MKVMRDIVEGALMTKRRRFQGTGGGSFYGDYLYDQVLAADSPYVLLRRLIDWDRIGGRFIACYAGKGCVGRPPYDPVLMLKMLLIARLYGVSERQVEEVATYHLGIKYFLGLAVDARPPDHSTLTKFKERLLADDQLGLLGEAFDDLLRQAQEQGIVFGTLQVLDSVHTVADVNNEKDRDRQEHGQAPRDPEATVVNKGKREVVEPDGKRTKREVRYKGYKCHVSVNAATGLVTTAHAALGNSADNKAFPGVLAHDRTLQLPTTRYGGDRAYDDTDIYARLESEGLQSAISLHDYRTSKKDANKQRWIDLQNSAEYQQAKGLRYRVEQPFGVVKQRHGFRRCCYLGLERYKIQALTTFLIYNAKRIMKLLTGITFRPLAKGRRAEVFTPVYAR